MLAGGIIFLVSFVAHVIQRGADKKSATGQAKETETEHERKASSVADKTAQSAEKAPTQTVDADKTNSDETTGMQNIQNQMNTIFSMVSHLFYMNKDAESRSNGTKFEECIKGKFKSPNFSLTDNRERHPDFVVDFSANGETQRLAVECKWRSKFQSDGKIEFCSSTDLTNYKRYEAKNKRQTFIALGVQHPADAPADLCYPRAIH